MMIVGPNREPHARVLAFLSHLLSTVPVAGSRGNLR